MFKSHVVKSNLPLLWSRAAMSRAGTILDLPRNRAKILGVWVNLNMTAAGHYCLNILPKDQVNCDNKEAREIVKKQEELEDEVNIEVAELTKVLTKAQLTELAEVLMKTKKWEEKDKSNVKAKQAKMAEVLTKAELDELAKTQMKA